MKRIICLMTLLSLAFGCTLLAQSEPQIETTCTTARLSFETSLNSETISISIFKDTLIFEENFENFLSDQVNSATPIGGAACLVEIPHSLTQFPGCRAQNIQVKDTNWAVLYKGKFATPQINIPQSSSVSLKIKSTKTKSLKINDNTITSGSGTKYISYIVPSNCNEIVFSSDETKTLHIDYIKIISPREVLPAQNYAVENGELLINNLLPNTGYYVEITDNQNQVSEKYFLKTKKRNQEIISRIQDPNSVKLEWENCGDCSPTSLSLYKVENATKDLFFSRIATTSDDSNFGLEVFNGTGNDICLGDYELVLFNLRYNSTNGVIRYRFSEKDSIIHGSYVSILYKLNALSQYNYITFPLKLSDALRAGNDAFLLLKKDAEGNYRDTVDLFGQLSQTPNSTATFTNTILTRKTTIRQGIKKNPTNIQIPYFKDINSEWDSVPFNATNLNDVSLRHSLATPVTYTYVGDYSLEAQNNELVLSGLNSQTKYLCILKRGTDTLFTHTFSTGNIVETQSSGSWSESSVWSDGVVPETYDKVIVNKGHKITIAEGESVSCSDLVLCSDYSASPMDNGKSELSIEGTFSVNNVEVQASFDKYTENVNGWHLFGVPIDVNSSTRESIAESFNRGYEDDLYYLDEARYAWIPYLQNVEDANFFTNKHGYLVAYKDDKTLSFKGDLFLEDSIVLLNNASYNQSLGNGYHLVCNPYPFSVGLNNFTFNNVSGMWLLNPQTGAYVPNDNNLPGDFTVPPFSGLMTKVDNATNSLVLRKKAVAPDQNTNAKSVIENLKFRLLSDGGYDEMKIYFRSDSDSLYDKYDTYKMFSIGSAPDLYCSINDLSLSIASLSELDDSLRLRINILSKDVGDLKLQLYEYTGDFERVDLLDADSESLVCSLLDDSLYSISYNSANEIRTFDLLVKKRVLSSVNKEDNEIEYIQIGRNIEIKNPQQIEEVVLFDIQGREILRTETEFLTLPFEGSFVLVIKSNGKEYFTKIISI
ncbi:MAG: hypothetical protein U0M28_08130 [Bacteroidales bacterium]|nr:hypothetical protein [Bacteroidales bacterium]